jgi:hypothetical protein
MATVTGGGSGMGNASQGTRGLSAGDWIRIQRIKAAKGYGLTAGVTSATTGTATSAIYPKDKDIAPPEPGQIPYGKALLIPYEGAGTSKILRPASNWTDFVASQTGDYISVSQNVNNGIPTGGVVQTQTKLCSAVSAVLPVKSLNQGANAFNRLKILS